MRVLTQAPGRDLADRRLYIAGSPRRYPTLNPLIGGTINVEHIRAHWDEVLRLASSIRQGTVTASLMVRKLGSYPRQNGLAIALRELGRIKRTLFTLEWLQNTELRRRVHVGLNKGEARNALARAVFFNRLGELRDRSFEDQRHRALGLNRVVSAIVLWNPIPLERAVKALAAHGHTVAESLLQHLSPLGWDHIALTGDYTWMPQRSVERAISCASPSRVGLAYDFFRFVRRPLSVEPGAQTAMPRGRGSTSMGPYPAAPLPRVAGCPPSRPQRAAGRCARRRRRSPARWGRRARGAPRRAAS